MNIIVQLSRELSFSPPYRSINLIYISFENSFVQCTLSLATPQTLMSRLANFDSYVAYSVAILENFPYTDSPH